MADVYNRVFLHLIWTTWDRLPKLTTEARTVACRTIISVGEECQCPVQAVNGVEDHLHIVVRFATTISIAELVKRLKGASSRAINEAFPEHYFKWQGGYGVVPVGQDALPRVIAYVQNQEQHHRDKTTAVLLEMTQQPISVHEGGHSYQAANSFDGSLNLDRLTDEI
jgi:putative transposase